MDIINWLTGTSARRQKAEDMAMQAHLERVRSGQMTLEQSEAVRVKTLADMGYAPAAAPPTLRDPKAPLRPDAPPPPSAPLPAAAQGYQNYRDNRDAVKDLDPLTGKPKAPAPPPVTPLKPPAIGEANPANAEVLEAAGMGSPLRRRPVQP
jgi:hypothetical protein